MKLYNKKYQKLIFVSLFFFCIGCILFNFFLISYKQTIHQHFPRKTVTDSFYLASLRYIEYNKKYTLDNMKDSLRITKETKDLYKKIYRQFHFFTLAYYKLSEILVRPYIKLLILDSIDTPYESYKLKSRFD